MGRYLDIFTIYCGFYTILSGYSQYFHFRDEIHTKVVTYELKWDKKHKIYEFSTIWHIYGHEYIL